MLAGLSRPFPQGPELSPLPSQEGAIRPKNSRQGRFTCVHKWLQVAVSESNGVTLGFKHRYDLPLSL